MGTALGLVGFLLYQGFNIYPLIFLATIVFVMMQLPGIKGFGRRPATLGGPPNPGGITFSDIGGQVSAKRELLEALDFVVNQEEARKFGIRPLKGILLTGPPGTGKTLLAKAAANHCQSVFLAASGSEFIEMYAGVGAQRVRELFRKARGLAAAQKKQSALVFIDEIEVLGTKRGQHSGHLEYDQTLNQLLVEMDGISPDEEVTVLVVGATNRADLLDSALLRPGRFDRLVKVDLPDREGRLAVLELHARGKPLDPAVDLDQVARETFGFSGAHLESLCNEGAILAMREGAPTITQMHLMEAIDKVILGERLDRRPNPQERERIAVHEAGHALVGETLEPGSVSSVTVSSRGNALGYVRHAPEADRYLYTRKLLDDEICGLMAGAVAEELVLGDRSTGAAGDFEKALEVSRRIVYTGLSNLGVVDGESLAQGDLNSATGEILRAQEERCRELLGGRLEVLSAAAAMLAEREALSGAEFRSLLNEQPAA